ncbi:hypothetical protein WJX72_004946 [[Myrmecia] bisecta]|uniref:Uncharacterized protein n=1 Tax=[Myrmecia] bisecta TaxID=41462 RepID=A0AAW1PNP7_9CHLO
MKPEETVGVRTLLARDRKLVDTLPDTFDIEEPSSQPTTLLDAIVEASTSGQGDSSSDGQISDRSGASITKAQQAAAKASASQLKLKTQAMVAAEQLATPAETVSDTRMTCGEAIKQGTAKLQAGKHEEALELFQQALELPGNGFFRLAGTVREYRCASEAEENAALYNMACVYAQTGRRESALTCLEAALENNFSDFQTMRTDPDLKPIKGPELDQLLSKYDGLLAKIFKRRNKEQQPDKPWGLCRRQALQVANVAAAPPLPGRASEQSPERPPVVDETGYGRAAAPPFTLADIKNAVPAHCWKKNTWRSFSYLARDVAVVFGLAAGAYSLNAWWAWPLYWLAQGTMFWALFVVGHDCGHQSFANNKTLNDFVGNIVHSSILVPYHGWRISHRTHHSNHGHVENDESWHPVTKGLYDQMDDLGKFGRLGFPWPMLAYPFYLWKRSPGKAGSHYDPKCDLFVPQEAPLVRTSNAFMLGMVGILAACTYALGPLAILNLYVMPYWINVIWLDVVTYLHHHGPSDENEKIPWYRGEEWSYLRGGLSTIDRDFGIFNNIHHDIGTHVLHHLFPQIPHYHLVEATEAVKPVFGDYYRDVEPSPGPLPTHLIEPLVRSFKTDHYVEDEGDIVYYKRDPKLTFINAATPGTVLEDSDPCTATGQVMSAQANFVRVRVTEPQVGSSTGDRSCFQRELLCVVRGLLKKIKQTVLVGDYVQVIGIDWVDGRGMVEDVLARKSELPDPAIANVDQVLLVFSADLPPFDPEQATRFLVAAEAADLPVIVLLNKADLLRKEACDVLCDMVQSWGYKVLRVSAASGDGLDSLADALQGRVSVFAGPSGVGKSSLINALRLGTQAAVSETMRSRYAGLEDSELRSDPAAGSHAGNGGDAQRQDGSIREGPQGETAEGPSSSLLGTTRQASGSLASSSAAESSLLLVNGSAAAVGVAHSAPQDRLQNGAPVRPKPHATDTMEQPTARAQHVREGTLSVSQPPESQTSSSDYQAVGDVSQIGRGKHTTRNVTLLDIYGGLLADTPGFNQPTLQDVTTAALPHCFPEIAEQLESRSCAFSNCQHIYDPGCGVREGWDRHPFYVDLHAELKLQEDVSRQRAASKKKREGTVRYKSQAGGRRTREALLEPKSHRRVNRRQVKQTMQDLINEEVQADEP